MNYVLEIIPEEDKAVIVRDAGTELGELYTQRGGYFRPGDSSRWVIDREGKSYLTWAPNYYAYETIYRYHFYFAAVMYSIELVGPLHGEVRMHKAPPESQRAAFKAALIRALELEGYRFIHFSDQSFIPEPTREQRAREQLRIRASRFS